jgi:hypothetical protein
MNGIFRSIAALALAACFAPAAAGDDAAPVRLRFEPRFILEAVARRMEVTLRPEVPLPAVHLESAIPLGKFQDAIEGQWSFRPPMVANVYSVATNEIYLSDDGGFYRRLKRTLDDSLAHEFVHYIQAKYFREDLTTDAVEMQAAEVQAWFRETYMRPARAVAAQHAAPGCALTRGADGTRAVRCGHRAPG